MWIDIACIVFVCVTANHLGLIGAIEDVIRRRLLIVNCVRCFTFWSVVAYLSVKGVVFDRFIAVLAISFLASYLAIWLELLEGYIDTLYMKLYEKIITADTDNAPAADADGGNTAVTVP